MRTFHLERDIDITGISGTGLVAEGVEFADGTALYGFYQMTTDKLYIEDKAMVIISTHPLNPDKILVLRGQRLLMSDIICPCERCGREIGFTEHLCVLENKMLECVVALYFCSAECKQQHAEQVEQDETWGTWRMLAIMNDAVLALYGSPANLKNVSAKKEMH